MPAHFRRYENAEPYGEDYRAVRDFLIELDDCNYHFGRWDWMIMNLGREGYDPQGLERTGLWVDGGEIAGVVAFDGRLGSAFLLARKGRESLKEEMLPYAKENFSKGGEFALAILDGDIGAQEIAAKNGFYPTQEKEHDSIFPIAPERLAYDLPKGFRIVSLAEDFDLYKYGQAMWKGFNHEMNAEGPFSFYWEKHSEVYKKAWDRPNIDLGLKIFVEAPGGDFVSHCGMWHDQRSGSAYVEPVATEPAYRKMGLGRAAVLEGIKRCGELGATKAFVGSSKQFYYGIGFRPFSTTTWWKEK
ncbi:MAG: GNAT family N-acetyltransferase [Treponema sp.]|nr:GNAT family N-acetyltransferase [Treponema sp.]